jgi:hypothetical protein
MTRLDERITGVMNALEPGWKLPTGGEAVDLLYYVVAAASEFWRENPDDFCLQHSILYDGTIIFGGLNRVRWNAQYGFHVLESSCTPSFLAHAKKAPVFHKLG